MNINVYRHIRWFIFMSHKFLCCMQVIWNEEYNMTGLWSQNFCICTSWYFSYLSWWVDWWRHWNHCWWQWHVWEETKRWNLVHFGTSGGGAICNCCGHDQIFMIEIWCKMFVKIQITSSCGSRPCWWCRMSITICIGSGAWWECNWQWWAWW